jgi:hypothetical protein
MLTTIGHHTPVASVQPHIIMMKAPHSLLTISTCYLLLAIAATNGVGSFMLAPPYSKPFVRQTRLSNGISSPLSLSAASAMSESVASPRNNDAQAGVVTATKLQGDGPMVRSLGGPEELFQLVDSNQNNDRLIVVKYYADYCKICQRAGMHYQKIAKNMAETDKDSIVFAKLESSTCLTSDQLRSMGITKFPFVQIFRHGLCVASFSTGPVHLFGRKVQGSLDTCRQRSSQEWDDFMEQFETEIQDNLQARQQIQQHELLSTS